MNKTPVTLPLLSDTMQTGRLARWLKQPGDPIKTGDVLAEVESDKAVMEVEAYADGYLAGPLAPTDTDIPVQSTIAWITDVPVNESADESADESASESAAAPPPAAAAPATPTPTAAPTPAAAPPTPAATTPPTPAPASPTPAAAPTPAAPAAPAAVAPAASDAPSPVVAAALAVGSDDAGASPFARGLATELGIDLTQLTASADGRIGAAQVLAAALGPQFPHLELGPIHSIERPSPIKAAMAENMARSEHTPTFHVTAAIDLAPLHDAAHAHHESLSLLLARACALSIHEHPDFNACWTPRGLARRERIDVAIAVDTPDGLITPVLRNALRPLDELNEDWRELKGKLQNRRLKPQDYSGATFYLSNLGTFPVVEQFDAIVPLGAASILAVSAAGPDGLTRLTLSCDHRVVAGADAARFLTTLSQHLSAVEALQQ